MRRLAVEGQRFDGAVGDVEDGAAGRLVDAARFHADEAVLDEVDPADAVVAAEPVEVGRGSVAGLIALPSTATGRRA